MDRFVVSQNIQHFRHLLETVSDPQQRRAIGSLLEEEILKLPSDERRSYWQSEASGERRSES